MKKRIENFELLGIIIILLIVSVILLALYFPVRNQLEAYYLAGLKRLSDSNAKYINHLYKMDLDEEQFLDHVDDIVEDYLEIVFINEKMDNQSMLLEEADRIGYVYNLEADEYYYISASKTSLYALAHRIINTAYVVFILALVVLLIIVHFIVVRNARKIVLTIEKSKDEYKDQAYKDQLTGAYTRQYLDNWVKNKFNYCENCNQYHCDKKEMDYTIAIIDGDNFKKINDNYGHIAGDKALIKITESLKESVREGDLIIRLGGDEFLVILENCSGEIAQSVLERVRDKLKNDRELDFDLDISYGIYEIDEPEEFFKSLDKADKEMYQFKQGKNLIKNMVDFSDTK